MKRRGVGIKELDDFLSSMFVEDEKMHFMDFYWCVFEDVKGMHCPIYELAFNIDAFIVGAGFTLPRDKRLRAHQRRKARAHINKLQHTLLVKNGLILCAVKPKNYTTVYYLFSRKPEILFRNFKRMLEQSNQKRKKVRRLGYAMSAFLTTSLINTDKKSERIKIKKVLNSVNRDLKVYGLKDHKLTKQRVAV